ncbi:MAG: maf [Hyphomicrobiales bacterium]|nr:maf [Hyphomicrobiales bacterium]
MTLWKEKSPLILASTSATRLQLLIAAGLPVKAVTVDLDERALEFSLQSKLADPRTIALELAKAKAETVAMRYADCWVLAADQTLALGNIQFHKPIGIHQAAEHLRMLSGQTHHLNSAVCLYRDGVCRFEHVETAMMKMRSFGEAFVADYLDAAGDAVTRSVGAYQMEGLGVHLFERIEGDHATILGLPILPLLAFLRSAGALES